jgi:hypothetical protein
MAYYGSLAGANEYFDARLHSEGWLQSSPDDRPKALTAATTLIDTLNYRGVKNAVWLITFEDTGGHQEQRILTSVPTRDQIIVADLTQPLEFPRGKDTAVPEEIEWACYEIALALLEGFDPEDAVNNTNVIRQTYAAVRTTYADDSVSQEYLVYGIPTARVWGWLKPRLVLDGLVRLSRAN